jgi:hypothetical protein
MFLQGLLTISSAIAHLGPVNTLSLCNGVLFLEGSDLTTRSWNFGE